MAVVITPQLLLAMPSLQSQTVCEPMRCARRFFCSISNSLCCWCCWLAPPKFALCWLAACGQSPWRRSSLVASARTKKPNPSACTRWPERSTASWRATAYQHGAATHCFAYFESIYHICTASFKTGNHVWLVISNITFQDRACNRGGGSSPCQEDPGSHDIY
jgi:hypothetical protein